MERTTTREVAISVRDLEVGMHVVRLDRPWEETPFLLQGFVIHSPDEVRSLQAHCDQVWIEVHIDSDQPPPVHSRPTPTADDSAPHSGPSDLQSMLKATSNGRTVRYLNQVSFDRAVEASRMTYRSAHSLATSIMNGLRVGQALDINECRSVVEEVVSSILDNHEALRFLGMIKHQDQYTAEHSMNVCILSAMLARHLGLIEPEIKKAALGGLLHDVGKSRIPSEILNKPGRLSREEAYLMAEHTTHGRSILMSTKGDHLFAVDVAFAHHERMDGRGYPRGMRGRQIPFYAKLVALADAYDAMTSHRSYSKAKTSEQALRIIARDRGDHFDPELARAFIRCIGLFTTGTLVRLEGGQLAIVTETNPDRFRRPKVLVITRPGGTLMDPPTTIDLAHPANQALSIEAEVPNGTEGIDVAHFIERHYL